MNEYETMTHIGKKYGITCHQLGKILKKNKLRASGGTPSPFAEELGLVDPSAHGAGLFDELDPVAGWVRHHLFVVDLQDVRQVRAAEGQTLRWWRDGASPLPLATAAARGRARARHTLRTEDGARPTETLRPQNTERFGASNALDAPADAAREQRGVARRPD